jgi:hypothetical protein
MSSERRMLGMAVYKASRILAPENYFLSNLVQMSGAMVNTVRIFA